MVFWKTATQELNLLVYVQYKSAFKSNEQKGANSPPLTGAGRKQRKTGANYSITNDVFCECELSIPAHPCS